MNAGHLTIRNVPPDLAAALSREKKRRGVSLNQTVIDLLKIGVGVSGPRSNGLGKLAGTWSAADYKEFVGSIAELGDIEPEIWK